MVLIGLFQLPELGSVIDIGGPPLESTRTTVMSLSNIAFRPAACVSIDHS